MEMSPSSPGHLLPKFISTNGSRRQNLGGLMMVSDNVGVFFCNEGFCKAIVRYIYFFTEGGGSATMDVYIYMCVLSVSNIYIYICVDVYVYVYMYIPLPRKKEEMDGPKKRETISKRKSGSYSN